MMNDGRVYLDYNATTPLAPEVLESINVALRDFWGNPSSGHDAGEVVAEVRRDGDTELACCKG